MHNISLASQGLVENEHTRPEAKNFFALGEGGKRGKGMEGAGGMKAAGG